jgi:hypothetical protein
MNRKEISEYLEERGETAVLADGFDDALIGFSQRINEPLLAVYSLKKIVEMLMEGDDMSYEEALEYADFNILGAWVGPQTPIFVYPLEP